MFSENVATIDIYQTLKLSSFLPLYPVYTFKDAHTVMSITVCIANCMKYCL